MTRQRFAANFVLGAGLVIGSAPALAFDEDRNGVIVREEAMGWSKTEFSERFDDADEVTIEDFEVEMPGYAAVAIDEDGNGMISPDEWSAYTQNRFEEAGDEMTVEEFEAWVERNMQ